MMWCCKSGRVVRYRMEKRGISEKCLGSSLLKIALLIQVFSLNRFQRKLWLFSIQKQQLVQIFSSFFNTRWCHYIICPCMHWQPVSLALTESSVDLGLEGASCRGPPECLETPLIKTGKGVNKCPGSVRVHLLCSLFNTLYYLCLHATSWRCFSIPLMCFLFDMT